MVMLFLILFSGCVPQCDPPGGYFLAVERFHPVLLPSRTAHCSYVHIPGTISEAG